MSSSGHGGRGMSRTDLDQSSGERTAAGSGAAPHPASGRRFVGRDRELATLITGLEAALSGHGHLYLVSGEPGVGKTRLLQEVATAADERGVIAVWGRCWEGDDAPPFWPWVQVLRTLLACEEAAPVLASDAHVAAEIARLVPLFRAQRHGPSEPGVRAGDSLSLAAPDSEVERFRLLDAVAQFVREMAGKRPVVLLLDDLHAAHLPSLLLLELLARDLGSTRLLVVAAYRDTNVGRLSARLGELARLSTAIPLRGLDVDATRTFITAVAGRQPPERVVTLLQEATEGNPFFLDELVRLLLAENRFDDSSVRAGQLGVPERVRSAVRARLEPLNAESRAILDAAAAVGQDLDPLLLESVVGATAHDLRAALAFLTAAGFVQPVAPGGFRFAHALIRETIYDDIVPARRVRLHCAIGIALEVRHANRPEAALSALAYHFLRGQSDADASKALAYARRAGARAFDLCAYEDAVGHFEQALTLLDSGRAVPADERAQLLLALARAAARVGDLPRAQEALRLAAEDARCAGSVPLLIEAALEPRVVIGKNAADSDRIRLLEEVLTVLPVGEHAQRARVLSQLACELRHTSDVARREALSREAVALARGLGDRRILAVTLANRCTALWGLPEQMRESSSVELLDLAKEVGDRELIMEAHRWRVMDLLVSCDLPGADREISAATQLAERLRQPYYLWWCAAWRASRTALQGRFAEGESQANEAYALGQRVQPHEASAVLSAQLWVLLWFRGEFNIIVPMIEAFASQNETVYPEIRIAMAAAYAGAKRLEDARRQFETIAAGDFQVINVQSGEWLYSLANLAQTCASIGDSGRAGALYRLMEPYAGRAIVTLGSLSSCGPVDRYLGLLASVREDWDAAEAHFRRSLELSRRLTAPPFICWTQQNHAAMLCARGRDEDRARAESMLAEALTTADALGMSGAAAEVRELMSRLASIRTVRAPVRAVDADASSMLCEGEYWTFHYCGSITRLRDRAGMSYLATLLERPHGEVPALNLIATLAAASASQPREPGATPGEWPGDLGEILDPRARAEYRQRLEDLQAELDEAERAHDIGRVERARAERETLQQALSRALGFGGRVRRTGSPAERARVRVTRAIRESIDRIRAANADLGDHLARSIRTGTYCCYAPAEPASWTIVRASSVPSR